MKRHGRFSWPHLTALLSILVAAPLWAQEDDTDSQREARFGYTRVDLPTRDADQWHRFKFGYEFETLQRSVDDFHRLLEAANANPQDTAKTFMAPRAAAAEYAARLVDNSLVGTGRLDVRYDGEAPGFLSLDGCRIAIEDAQWEDDSAAPLGVASDGRVGTTVEKDGSLRFAWSLRAEQDSSGVSRLAVALPRATRSRLALEVPKGVQLITSRGVVDSQQRVGDDYVRFEIALGGHSNTEILLVPQALSEAPSGPIVAQQESRYEISTVGFTLRTRFNLHVPAAAFTQPVIDLDVDPGLQPVSVTLNGQAASWQPHEEGDGIQVQLSQPLSPQSDNLLDIKAVGAIDLGEAKRLPTMRSAEMLWLAEAATLVLDPAISISRLDVEEGNVTSIAGSPTEDAGTSVEVRLYRQAGRATVTFDNMRPLAMCDRVFTGKIAEDRAVGHLSAVLRSTRGVIHETSFVVPPFWSFGEQDITVFRDNGEDKPAEAVSHRLRALSVQPRGRPQRVRLAFSPPLQPGQRLRIEIVATYERPLPAASISLEQLCFAQWPKTESGRTVIALATDSPLTARVSGGPGLKPLTVKDLDQSTRDWLQNVVPSVVVEAASGTGEARLRMLKAAPHIQARIEQVAVVSARAIVEKYDVECLPNAAGFDRLRVMFWPPRKNEPQWSFPAELVQAGLQTRRIEPSSEADSPADLPEVWEIRLPAHRSEPFQFSIQRATMATDEGGIPLSLLSVAGAVQQHGRVVIIGHRDTPISVKSARVQPVAPSPTELQSAPDEVVWGAFRYAPTQARAPIDARVVLAFAKRNTGKLDTGKLDASKLDTGHTFAWHMLLTSTYSPGAISSHRAAWLINSDSRDAVHLTMPPKSEVRSIAVNGVQQAENGKGDTLRIPIGESNPLAFVSVEFTMPQTSWGMWNQLTAPAPVIDIPVLRRRWLLSPPGGYSPPATQSTHVSTFDKLLGVLRDGTVARDLSVRGRHAETHQATSLVADLQHHLLAPEATWGQALLGSQLLSIRDGSESPRLLLIDAAALSSLGIAPEQPVTTLQPAPTTLAEVLAGAGVALVLVENHALLTDEQFIRRRRARLSPTDIAGVWRVSDQALAALFDDRQTLAFHYVTPQVWASAFVPAPATQRDAPSGYLPSDQWSEVHLRESGMRVTVYHRASLQAIALVALIGCAALVLYIPRIRPRPLVAAACLMACLTIALESPWHLLPWGAAAGIVLGAALAMTRRRRRARTRNAPHIASRAVQPLLLLASLTMGIASVAGADGSATTVYPVWFPVDDEGKSTNVVHLPKRFGEALTAMAKANAQPQREWLIDRADYRLDFQWDAVDERLTPSELEMEIEIVVLDDVTQIELPLPRGELALPDDWAMLNDTLIEPNWRLGQASLRIPVAGRGRQRLRLRVRPPVLTQNGTASLTVPIPVIPQARLFIAAPAGAPRIDVTNCLGRIQVSPPDDAERQTIEAALGAVETLRVSWIRQQSELPSDAVFEVEEWLWLDLSQPQPTVQARFKGKLLRGEMTHLRIAADRRMQVQTADAQRINESDGDDDAIAFYRLPVSKAEDGFTASVTFKLPAAPTAGKFALPLLRPSQARRRRQWVAVRTPAHHAKVSPGIGLAKASVVDFMTRWPEQDPAPQAVYTCDLRQPARLIAITPSPQPLSLSETTSCLYSHRAVDCNYRAIIELGASRRQLLSFDIPPGLTVGSVSAKSRSADAPDIDIAWWGVDGRQLQVFLRTAPAASYELAITASAPLGQPRRMKVPLIHAINAQVTASRVEIHRQRGVLVDIVKQAGFATVIGDVQPLLHSSRPVALLQAQLEKISDKKRFCTVQVRTNKITAQGEQVTQLVSNGSLWHMRLDISIDVRGGKLDTLQFEVPSQLAQTITIEPPQQIRIFRTLDSNTRRLVIIPAEPIDGPYQATLMAKDVIPPGEDVRVPEIRPLFDIPLARYVAVPTSFESRDIAWKTDGLQRLGEGAINTELAARFTNVQLFQVVADSHQATLRSLTEVAGVPLVRLADVHFAWDSAGQCCGRALIDLEPAGLSDCVVELPAAMRLCQLRIDDLPGQATALPNNRWRLKLQSTKLPQRIVILYTGQLAAADHTQHVTALAPVLADIAIERTLWTVYAPADAGEPVLDTPNLHPTQQSVIRLRAMTDMVRLPRHLRLEYSSRETRDWLVPWQQRWQRERQRLERGQLVQAAISPGVEQLRLPDVDFNFQQAVDELELSGVAVEPPAVERSPEEYHFQRLVAGTRVATRRMAKGTSRQLPLRFQAPPPSQPRLGKYAASLAFLAAGVLAWLSPRWLPRSDWPLRCGYAIVLAVTMAVALALWPSLLFWAIVVVLVAGWVWLRRSSPADPLRSAILVQSSPREASQAADNQ